MPRRSPTVASLLAPAALALLAACATPASKMSFGDAGFDLAAEGDELAPPVQNPAPEAVATEAPQGPPIDPVLLRFAAEARSRRSRHPASRGFPVEAVQAWRILAADLDQYLQRPLPQTPLLELVRARVTLDAEWDYDQRRYGAPPQDLALAVLARAGRLSARIDTARAVGLALLAKPPPARMRWPVEQAGISSLFGLRADPFDRTRRMHRGVDFSAERGELVEAAAAGWVVRAGPAGGYGLMVEVRHPGDVTTRYGHLSAILCTPGEAIAAGQPVGLIGQTGRATGPHLHFEVWKDGMATDPLPWLTGDRGDRVAQVPTPSRKGSGGPR
jgi:murein DD-endopeptidase MepM/ murein hydrolase activator NlpD